MPNRPPASRAAPKATYSLFPPEYALPKRPVTAAMQRHGTPSRNVSFASSAPNLTLPSSAGSASRKGSSSSSSRDLSSASSMSSGSQQSRPGTVSVPKSKNGVIRPMQTPMNNLNDDKFYRVVPTPRWNEARMNADPSLVSMELNNRLQESIRQLRPYQKGYEQKTDPYSADSGCMLFSFLRGNKRSRSEPAVPDYVMLKNIEKAAQVNQMMDQLLSADKKLAISLRSNQTASQVAQQAYSIEEVIRKAESLVAHLKRSH